MLLVQLMDDVAFLLLQTLDVPLQVLHVFFVIHPFDHLIDQLSLVFPFL